MQKKPKTNLKRHRNQFRAWLTYELNKRGAHLTPQSEWRAIKQSIEEILLRDRQ